MRWLLVLIIFAIFSLLLLLLFLTRANNGKSVSQSQIVHVSAPGFPILLRIPAINVNAAVQRVGVTPQGNMDVPSNTVDVAWFKLGPRPGEKGSAVIAGHFDGQSGEPGVFIDLYKLKKEDAVYVQDDTGKSIAFVVRETRTYDPGYAEDVFSTNDTAHLNLVTCDGVWDGVKKSYSKRLVVFADIVR